MSGRRNMEAGAATAETVRGGAVRAFLIDSACRFNSHATDSKQSRIGIPNRQQNAFSGFAFS
jgi:hypothetical protein